MECRKKYCHPHNKNLTSNILKEATNNYIKARRSCENTFDFQKNCLFCGKSAKLAGAKRGTDVYPVRTLDFQNTIREFCAKRNDSWASEVHGRLEFGQDLPAVEARYHQSCSSNFRTG